MLLPSGRRWRGDRVAKPVIITKNMGVDHKDFDRLFLRLTNGMCASPVSGSYIVAFEGGGRLLVSLGPEQARQIANLAIPHTDVTLSFADCSESDRQAFLAEFDRAFQRGGG